MSSAFDRRDFLRALWSSAIGLKAVADTGSHPVKIFFNTHWHGDHVGSNELLGNLGVKIIAHQNAKFWLSEKVKMEVFNTTMEPLKPEGLPTQTFTEGGKMTFGKEKIEYKWFPNAHTETMHTCSFRRRTCSIPATCFSAACIR